MKAKGKTTSYAFSRALCLLPTALLFATFLVPSSDAQKGSLPGGTRLLADSPVPAQNATSHQQTPTKSELTIPPGTILPVRLDSSLSSSKSKPNQPIRARIMQDVPLSGGVRIRQGSQVIGHIVEVVAASGGSLAKISLQFDKLSTSHQTIPITTNLRAIAGFVAVRDAQTPPVGPGESDVYEWLTTTQIGGDVVYGQGGIVTKGDTSQVVGKAVPGGVLSQISAKAGTKCRGPLFGNESPQALWVFSSDACGTYGLTHIEISHAGRSDPAGVIVLQSNARDLTLPSGTGMLLRVDKDN